ncbi:MAG: hypothetical protein LBK66_07300 [Spirochaetaceae bacterium]|nr:hypothetical protein [Spirochaetaceae bacterium]
MKPAGRRWQVASRVCKAPFSDPKVRSEDRFGYAGVERMGTHWWANAERMAKAKPHKAVIDPERLSARQRRKQVCVGGKTLTRSVYETGWPALAGCQPRMQSAFFRPEGTD